MCRASNTTCISSYELRANLGSQDPQGVSQMESTDLRRLTTHHSYSLPLRVPRTTPLNHLAQLQQPKQLRLVSMTKFIYSPRNFESNPTSCNKSRSLPSVYFSGYIAVCCQIRTARSPRSRHGSLIKIWNVSKAEALQYLRPWNVRGCWWPHDPP